jgi:glycosyltransferase involved in cell wall biosynthesis
MLLSLIIPVYNVENYLRECLDSVFAQDLQDCEVICVNDGSTDNSMQILQDYKKTYTDLLIIDQQNGGLSDARNAGIKAAKGECVFFLDSDDYLLPNVLVKVKEKIQHNSIDIFVFNALINGENPYVVGLDVIENKVFSGREYAAKSYALMRTFVTAAWLHVYRKDFLLNNQLFYEKRIYHEDEYFTPQALFFAQSVEYTNLPLIYYRINREGAITAKITEKHINDRLYIGRNLFAFFQAKQCNVSEFYRKILEFYIITVRMMIAGRFNSKSYLTDSDAVILQHCAVTDFERKCVKLYKINPKLMLKYWNNSINPILRKLINRFL